ncbi:MAG: YbjN domain-containing protein [Propionibacteriaceae bacterium]|jgi:hypothetical protein|nr:YbjN domain-containing protein [Propionibacteriaceae bacterium]
MSLSHDFDIDRSTEHAWSGFEARLGEVLSMMDATEPLTLSTLDGQSGLSGYVRFVALDSQRLLALVPDNVMMPSEHRLSSSQIEALLAAGWRPPDPAAADDRLTHYWLTGSQTDSDRLARAAVAVLRDVFGVHHPVFLAADVLAEILQGPTGMAEPGELIDWAGLPSDEVTAIMPANSSHLRRLVEQVLSDMPDITPMRDADGDFAIRVGSTMVFVRVPQDGAEVLVFAPLVHDVDGRSRAAEVLNDINAHARWVRFALLRDRVFVTMSILAQPFVGAHLRQAISELCKVADGVDDLLASSLHGRTTFTDSDSPGPGAIDLV